MIYILNKAITFLVPLLPKSFIRIFSNRYIAGTNRNQALKIITKLNHNFLTTIDILGEHTQSISEANLITEEYIKLYNQINSKKLNCNVSIKLSHIGADINESTLFKNLDRIHSASIKNNNFLRLDMEDSSFTDKIINAYKYRYKTNNQIGIVIQAYLRRSQKDIKRLNVGANIRLCKGIYNELEKIAIKDPEEINNNYIRLFRTAIKKKIFVGIATHDSILIKNIIEIIKNEKINKRQFEFQFLYGVPMGDTIQRIRGKGFDIRIYAPFGKEWYEYSIRRLKENPNISGYIIKNIFKSNFYK